MREIGPFTDYSYREVRFFGDDLVFFGSDMLKHGLNQDSEVYHLRLADRHAELILPAALDLSFGSSVNSDLRRGGGDDAVVADGWLYYIYMAGPDAHLARVDAAGQVEALYSGEGSVEELTAVGQRLVYTAFRDGQPARIYVRDEAGDAAGERLLVEEAPLWPGIERATLERFDFDSAEDRLEAYVLLPPGYDHEAEAQYPALLAIHGGPKTAYGTIAFHEMELLAQRGYLVYYCNPRGSDGGGWDWADIRGDYGGRDYAQLMDLSDAVLARYPGVDPARLGVLGGSYGGYITNWIIGHTERFAAACSQRSISNWMSMYGVSDIGYYFVPDQMAASPWEDDALWAASPLRYALRAKTPTLFIHSDRDYRCPLGEGLQIYSALQMAGVETRMVVFKGASHGLSRAGAPRQRIRRLEEILAWFDRHLGVEPEAADEETEQAADAATDKGGQTDDES